MFTLNEIITATRGNLLYGKDNPHFKGVSIDSRTVRAGEMFVCIKGERFNGHDFIADALKKGAEGVLVSQGETVDEDAIPAFKKSVVIKTDNTIDALGKMAGFHRKRFSIPVIGITGSNGKTTTKEMTAAILDARHRTLKNEGNLNNLIGVPLTLFHLDSQHKGAIIEMGMNQKGEIKKLCGIAEPTVGVVTNICEAHMEGFDSLREIKEEKEELVKSLSQENTAILNCDDPLVYEMRRSARGRVITYGLGKEAIVKAEEIKEEEMSMFRFTLRMEKAAIPVRLPVCGHHNIYNAISAAAAGMAMNMDIEDIKKGIERFSGPPMRMEIIQKNNMTIINDAYNANPASVKAALCSLASMASEKTHNKVFIFGDMLELGCVSQEAHKNIGGAVLESGIDILITAGNLAALTAEEAVRKGMPVGNVYKCKDTIEASGAAREHICRGDRILVKGSRKMRMENVISSILSVT